MSGNLRTIDASIYGSWPTPNYTNPERRTWMPILSGVLLGVSTVAVVTRLWLRTMKKAGPLGLDDALLLPGWLGAITFTVFCLLSSERYGSGIHIWDVVFWHFVPLAKMAFFSEIAYMAAAAFIKCSILCFYRRLTKGTFNKRWEYLILSAIAFTALYTVTFIFTLSFSCSPTAAYWESRDPFYQKEFKCIDSSHTNTLSGALSIASDLYSVLLPCIMLRNFECPRHQKIALYSIFSLGLIIVAAGAARTYYLEKVGTSIDLTYLGFDVFVWAQIEVHLALICASAPVLRVFFRDYLTAPVKRVLTSGRTDSRQESRRTSKRLPDESSGSSQRSDVMPLTNIQESRHSTLGSLNEDDIENPGPPYDEVNKEWALHRREFDDPVDLESQEVSQPPAAYTLNEKDEYESRRHGGIYRHTR